MSGDTFDFTQGNRETLRGTLHDPAATPGDVLTVQPDGSVAAAAGGGGAGYAKWVRFPFAFDTAGLDGGVLVYTPQAGEYILDCWIEVDTAWDGTTPLGDLSTVDLGDIPGSWGGIYNEFSSAKDMTLADAPNPPFTDFGVGVIQGKDKPSAAFQWSQSASFRVFPAKFVGPDFPVYICVSSSNGAPGGGDPGAAQGEGTAVLLIGTP